MGKSAITVSSVTYALRGQRLLAAAGIKGEILRSKDRTAGKSCSYSILVPREKLTEAMELLKKNEIRIIGQKEGNSSK